MTGEVGRACRKQRNIRSAYISIRKPEGIKPLRKPRCIFYLFIESLFNDAFSISVYIASNERIIVNNELERM
jgi:hypothetical protein